MRGAYHLRLRAGSMGLPPAPPAPVRAHVRLSQAAVDVTLSETVATTLTLTVARDNNLDSPCTVDLGWSSLEPASSFVAGANAGSVTLSFAAGETTKTLSIALASSAAGANFAIAVSLSNSVQCTVVQPATCACTVHRPSSVAPTAAADAATATIGSSVDIDVLANDTAAAAVTAVSISTAPTGGSAQVLTDKRVRYTPGASAADGSTDTFRYAVQPGGSSALVTVTRRAATTLGWGRGPKSNFPFWLACRLGAWRYFDRAALEADTFTLDGQPWQGLNRPMDILDAWSSFNEQDNLKVLAGDGSTDDAATQAKMWAWIAGADDITRLTDWSHFGGTMRVGYWPQMWAAGNVNQPFKLCLPLNTKYEATSITGGNWQFWFDLGRGVYDQYFRALGHRMAIKDQLSGRNCHRPANGLPAAPTIVNLGWEINRAQRWSTWSYKVPATATAPYVPGRYTYQALEDGVARVITALSDGYHDYTGWPGGVAKNCPYYFEIRPMQNKYKLSDTGALLSFRDAHYNWNTNNASLISIVGLSQHHSDLFCAPISANNTANNNSIWYGDNAREGLNSIGELADRYGWKIFLDEMGQHFAGGWATNEGYYGDYFVSAVHDWMQANLDRVVGLSFYAGDLVTAGGVQVCSTSLIRPPFTNAAGYVGGQERWPQASQKFFSLYRAA